MVTALTCGLLMLGPQKAPVQEGKGLYELAIGTSTGKNGYEELVKAVAIVASKENRDLGVRQVAVGTKDWLDRRRQALAKCGDAFDLVHIGLSKPIRHPNPEPTLSTTFPEMAWFKLLAEAMTYKSAVACADGRPDEAANVLADGLRMAAKVSTSGPTFPYVVGSEMNTVVLFEFERDRRFLTPAGLAAVRKAAEQSLQESPLLTLLDADYACVQRSMRGLVEDPLKAYREIGLKDQEVSSEPWVLKPQGERASTAASYLETWRLRAEGIKRALALPEAEWTTALANTDLPDSDSKVPWVNSLAQWPEPGLVFAEAVRLTRLRLVRLHCLILARQWKTGALPDTLAVVAQGEERTDPRTGREFHYQSMGKSYRLWADGNGGKGTIELKRASDLDGPEENLNPPPHQAGEPRRADR